MKSLPRYYESFTAYFLGNLRSDQGPRGDNHKNYLWEERIETFYYSIVL